MLPILYQSHDLILYSYPLLMGIGWGVAYQIFFGLSPKTIPLKQQHLLFWGIFLFAWLGAKTLFYLTTPEVPEKLLSQVSFWTGGGLVFYGGFLGATIFLGLYRLFVFKLAAEQLWPMVPALAIGHGIGRVGCFLAGCCFGATTEAWWGLHMHGADRHPTQLLEATGLLLLGSYILRSKRPKKQLVTFYLLSYGVLRFGIEMLRGDAIRGQWGVLTPSQWISLGLIGLGLAVLITQNQKLKSVHDH